MRCVRWGDSALVVDLSREEIERLAKCDGPEFPLAKTKLFGRQKRIITVQKTVSDPNSGVFRDNAVFFMYERDKIEIKIGSPAFFDLRHTGDLSRKMPDGCQLYLRVSEN